VGGRRCEKQIERQSKKTKKEEIKSEWIEGRRCKEMRRG
jgi:hypothetical protein